MTVAELMAELASHPPTAEVKVEIFNGDDGERHELLEVSTENYGRRVVVLHPR